LLRRQAFTLVELMTVVGIIAVLTGIVVPAIGALRETTVRVRCTSNLRQIGIAFGSYRVMDNAGQLPTRPSGLDQTNPHVLKYKSSAQSVANHMRAMTGSRDVFYCPGNYQERTASEWWPFASGTIAVTYQFPFWLKPSCWLISRPDYNRPASDAVVAADYLGSTTGPTLPLAWNHKLGRDGSPQGMNLLFGDGHVEWRGQSGGWVAWGRSNGPVDWYWAK
jgi:prepilin-type N-terminal cleavage/methylation domain-containing protein/prepilin-type processing-associated H-X9-DG protein